jgi:hypothetical protein
MKLPDMRSLFAGATLALLAACGGGMTTYPAGPPAPMVQANAPLADCEAEGCNRPRIVDGLAEQYRAAAIAQPAELAPADAPPSEAASGAGVAPQ